ncbi:hypothetical protein [Salsuginibacillus kocurii]|uniref:hypothetical protein n=1 Tax=Salsuginibacillus kocurii TaxID=427078 RepID=UPI00035D2F7B|nr:hypothetical protein [Salsuginibacillus kocurii]
MSNIQQVPVELPDDLYSEIEHMSQEEQDNWFHEVVRGHIKERRQNDLRFQMKRGYMEMAQINLEVAEAFVNADAEGLISGEAHVADKRRDP